MSKRVSKKESILIENYIDKAFKKFKAFIKIKFL